MIADFVYMPNMVACQYLDREFAAILDEWLGKMIKSNSHLAEAHRVALQAASTEFSAYEEWLAQQDRVDPASYLFDEDVPY